MDACDTCGFTVDDYTRADLQGAARALPHLLRWTVEGVGADVLASEPVAAAVAGVEQAASTVDAAAPEVAHVHQGLHGLRLLGRLLHEAGAGAPTHQGSVVQISASSGGVPKSALLAADVSRRGLVGDRQRDRKHHGRPFQAVSLWSQDLIDALRAEGHPIHAGAAGENLTLAGVEWGALRPGVRLLAGQVLLEVSAWATPCRKNDQWFTGRSDRIDHSLHPGWSRAYAWVLEPGTVTTGDPVVVEP